MVYQNEFDPEIKIPLIIDNEYYLNKKFPQISVEIWGSADISGNIGGNVSADGGINCGNIGGNVCSGGDVSCSVVKGYVSCEGDIQCEKIGGSAECFGNIYCKTK